MVLDESVISTFLYFIFQYVGWCFVFLTVYYIFYKVIKSIL